MDERDVKTLFRVDVPWPVRVWGDFQAWRKNRAIVAAALAQKRKFKHVATVKQVTTWTDVGTKSFEYYSLWENGNGQRRYEYRSGNYLLDKPEATKVFNQIVHPWLSGRADNAMVKKFELTQE